MAYYSNFICDDSNVNKTLFRSIERLLQRKPEKCLPFCSSTKELANKFVTFFENKIINIRCKLEVPETSELFYSLLDKSTLHCQLNTFSPTSIVELSKVAHTVASKSCSLDPFPAALLKEHLDLLLPTLYRLVHLSMESGHLPSSLKLLSYRHYSRNLLWITKSLVN